MIKNKCKFCKSSLNRYLVKPDQTQHYMSKSICTKCLVTYCDGNIERYYISCTILYSSSRQDLDDFVSVQHSSPFKVLIIRNDIVELYECDGGALPNWFLNEKSNTLPCNPKEAEIFFNKHFIRYKKLLSIS